MSAHHDLRAALGAFLSEAVDRADKLSRSRGVIRLRPDAETFADEIDRLPSCARVRDAAAEAAEASGYIVGSSPGRAGRILSRQALLNLGVASALLEERDTTRLAEELAVHLAGPAVEILDLIALDADIASVSPVPLVDGWELLRLSERELTELLPVASAADLARYLPYDVEILSRLALLRRRSDDQVPHSGLVFSFDLKPEHSIWKPLLALMLFRNPVIHFWASYEVEPQRRVDRLHDRIITIPWTPDGVVELERPMLGEWELEEEDLPKLIRFLEQLRPRLEAATTPRSAAKRDVQRVARLRRVVEHLLAAGEEARGHGEVESEHNADAVLHYVIALEGLLSGEGEDKQDLARKVAQRAAMLAGHDDASRIAVHDLVRSAYAARSTYAHGGEPEEVDVPSLRRIVRRCILASLVIPDEPAAALHIVADEALLSTSVREDRIRKPLRDFASASGLS